MGLGALLARSTAAEDLNMWDGQWHYEVVLYGWVPFMYLTVQLPPIAGGGNPTIETQPSQYLKYLQNALFLVGTIRKGD